MGHSKIHVFASEVLASVAGDASDVLMPIAIKHRSGLAGEIATRLRYIPEYLSAQELYQLPPDAQILSLQALQDLVEICNWPTLSTPGSRPPLMKNPQELHDDLTQLFKTKSSRDRVQKSITEFCKKPPDTIKPFQSRFAQLFEKLKNTREPQDASTDITNHSHSKPLPRDVYPNEVHRMLLDALKSYGSCKPKLHVTPVPKDPTENDWHLTRLCLNSGFRSGNELALFDIITATSEMAYWQEMTISVPIKDPEPKDVQKLQQGNRITFDPSKLSLMEYGDICMRLENPNYAKIYLDENCRLFERPEVGVLQDIISGRDIQLSELLKLTNLTVEHKVKLSYAIARAFWQFYNSELMNARWTSEDILFIPLQKDTPLEDIPLRAFVSFPFGSRYKESPAEFYSEGQYTHRYPRIFYLGIVLLEIGLGQALGLEHNPKLSFLGHINLAYSTARKKLKELKNEEWDGFQWKDYFIKAVENCLEPVNFKQIPRRTKSRRQGDSKDANKDIKDSSLSERRDALYRNVVAPLFWLAKVGFEDSEEIPMVPIRERIPPKSTFIDNKELQHSWNEIREHPSFLCGSSSSTEGFLSDLQVIAGHITRCRRLAKITEPIRVAILDTGCKIDLPFFKNSQRLNRLKGWKDFTTAGSKSEIDAFGHGTFMARLLMHVAPIVDIYLIRVAKNTDDLENNEENIAKAIEHAGLDTGWKVDVISMSFGFPNQSGKKYTVISDAIEKTTKNRDGSVLFLASAGNSSQRRKDFPASHRNVIPIYAVDPKGAFLRSNPAYTGKGPDKLGTYGTDIPLSIIREIQDYFPNADLSAGTSIATAIAAGIVSMTLSYIAALPSLLNFQPGKEVCAKIYTKKGMEGMLHAMSLNTDHQGQFISPIWFWGEKKRDLDIFVSVSSVAEKMDKEE
ncbi:S8 family peptidase [Xylogone sp. PMI_703]|nr:S8 family peptidase [Xylogone sp. PMI_703]